MKLFKERPPKAKKEWLIRARENPSENSVVISVVDAINGNWIADLIEIYDKVGAAIIEGVVERLKDEGYDYNQYGKIWEEDGSIKIK